MLRVPGQSYEAGAFDGYVSGVAHSELQNTWCPTHPFTQTQVSAVVSKYLRDRPDAGGYPPGMIVRTALGASFPCSRK